MGCGFWLGLGGCIWVLWISDFWISGEIWKLSFCWEGIVVGLWVWGEGLVLWLWLGVVIGLGCRIELSGWYGVEGMEIFVRWGMLVCVGWMIIGGGLIGGCFWYVWCWKWWLLWLLRFNVVFFGRICLFKWVVWVC